MDKVEGRLECFAVSLTRQNQFILDVVILNRKEMNMSSLLISLSMSRLQNVKENIYMDGLLNTKVEDQK